MKYFTLQMDPKRFHDSRTIAKMDIPEVSEDEEYDNIALIILNPVSDSEDDNSIDNKKIVIFLSLKQI